MDIQTFYNKCYYADWFYMMSDDINVYKRGKSEIASLYKESENNFMFEKILKAFEKYNNDLLKEIKSNPPELKDFI